MLPRRVTRASPGQQRSLATPRVYQWLL
ncbi:hypothetical protein [Geitlerinema sp. P-1104]